MKFSEWSDIIPSAIKMPYTIYKNKKSILYWIRHLQYWANVGSTNILVDGRAGTGKSVMVSAFYGEINDLSYEVPEKSLKVETRPITINDWTALVRVLPGQISKNKSIGMQRAFDGDSLDGILYVTNFGFTEIRDDFISKKLIEKDRIDTIAKYRQHDLQRELENFKLFASKLIDLGHRRNKRLFLGIVSNKADLYIDELAKAEEYYHIDGMSNFSRELQNIRSVIGSNQIDIACFPMCSYEKEFIWNDDLTPSKIGGTKARSALVKNAIKKLSIIGDYV